MKWIAAISLLVASSCAAPRSGSDAESSCEYRESVPSMGTFLELSFVSRCDESAKHALLVTIKDALDRMEASMSLYQSESQISRLNREGAIEELQPDFAKVLKTSLEYGRLTDGYFDVTVLPVMNLIRESFKGTQHPPSGSKLDLLRPLVNWKNVKLEGRSVRFRRAGVMITLDGVAKGYAVDRAAEIIERSGVSNYLVNFSGNMKLRGAHKDASEWSIAIRDPLKETSDKVALRSGEAIASSGPEVVHYSESFAWHHLINPKTLRPARGMIQTTVIGPSATVCDVLSTATFVAGEKHARAFMKRNFPQYRYRFETDQGRMISNF